MRILRPAVQTRRLYRENKPDAGPPPGSFEELLTTPDIFSERGVDLRVAFLRPYRHWTTEDHTPLQGAWHPYLTDTKRPFTTKIANQSGGYVMERRPDLEELDPIAAEIRPHRPVVTGMGDWHHHDKAYAGRPDLLADHLKKKHGPGDPIVLSSDAAFISDARDVDGWHAHPAKYVFCPAPTIQKPRRFNPENWKPEWRARHQEKYGCAIAGSHTHPVPVKGEGSAKRIEVHRVALPRYEDAVRIWLMIEGCLKADSVLSQIIMDNRPESVCSIPSVTCTNFAELEAFAKRNLIDKQVVIGPDADWSGNPLVVTQALIIYSFLKDLGLDVLIAAPPPKSGDLCGMCGGKWHKGHDDYLGAGHSLDDLVVINREANPAVEQWVRAEGARRLAAGGRHARREGIERDGFALQILSLIADDDGIIRTAAKPRDEDDHLRGGLSLQTLGRLLDTHPKNVSNTIKSLLARPGLHGPHALELAGGSLETRNGIWKGGYFDRSLSWRDTPLFRVPEEFRAIKPPTRRIRDLAPGERVAQFATNSRIELSGWIEQAREEEATAA